MKLLALPLHPFLLAAYFPLWLLSNNVGLFDAGDATRSLLWNLAFAGAVVAALRPIYGDWHRPAALTSVLLALCFAYSALTEKLLGLESGYPTLVLIAVVWVVLAVLCRRLRTVGSSITQVLNAVAVVMLIGPGVQVLGARSLTGPIETRVDAAVIAELALAPGPARGAAPSIHHIVLDGYSRQDVLRDLYGFDNGPFVAALRGMGFAVADGATTPYGQTLLAMSSIFSMNYLDEHVEVLRAASESPSKGVARRRLSRHFWNSPVRRVLAARGYRFVAIDTEYGPLRVGNADRLQQAPNLSGPTYFERELYAMTPFLPIYRRLAGMSGGLSREARRVVYGLGRRDPIDLPAPFLVYNHVVSPHPPFSIDRKGRPRPMELEGLGDGNHWQPGDPDRETEYRAGYLEKLRYTNAALLEHLRALIDDASGPLIIIVHGDHGGGLYLDHFDAARTCLKERFTTLLAVYSSGGAASGAIGDGLNLVNLYRRLFNAEFGAALPELPDRSHFVPWDDPLAFGPVDPHWIANYDDNCGGGVR